MVTLQLLDAIKFSKNLQESLKRCVAIFLKILEKFMPSPINLVKASRMSKNPRESHQFLKLL